MQYLLLIYDNEKELEQMPQDAVQKVLGDYLQFTNDIKASKHWLGSNRLQDVAAATTVRIRNGKTTTTDGPFAETREQLGGYYLIEAKDLDEALQIAAKIPSAKFGSIEVRPVWAMPG